MLNNEKAFSGEWAFLSNMYKTEIEFSNITFPSSEHAYVAAKTVNLRLRQEIAQLDSPVKAKAVGKKLDIRSDWERVRVPIMRAILLRKFGNPTLQKKLIETDPLPLVEVNWWGDTFWGVCKGQGENNLGKLLMEIRNIHLNRATIHQRVREKFNLTVELVLGFYIFEEDSPELRTEIERVLFDVLRETFNREFLIDFTIDAGILQTIIKVPGSTRIYRFPTIGITLPQESGQVASFW